MATTAGLRPTALLRRAIQVARTLEMAASAKSLRAPLQIAGYGFLVRNRRLAIAVRRLGGASAYEARLLMRTMLEIQINYAWIRLSKRHSRAIRFLRFLPLELLRLLENTATIFRPVDYEQRKKALEAERRKVRHLFRFRDSKGKMRWAHSWAEVSSVEARLMEVLRKESPAGQADPFRYGMYISFSSATHGSASSLQEVLRVADRRLVAVAQPEPRPGAHLMGAFLLLAWTIEAFAEDAKLGRQLSAQLERVSSAVSQLRERAEQRQIPSPIGA